MVFCRTREDLEAYLTKSDLEFDVCSHPEVFTVEALMKEAENGKMTGRHHKNLFLKDKKNGQLYLLVATHDLPVDLNSVGSALGIKKGNLRFASEDVLLETLGVRQGCVTVFALLNDTDGRVRLLLDAGVLAPDGETDSPTKLWFHPMVNTASLAVTVRALRTFLTLVRHPPVLLNFTDGAVTTVEDSA